MTSGAAAIQLEDQVLPKRCGHMEGKEVVPVAEFVGKIRAAIAARRSRDFVVIARTDARAVHGLEDALRRAAAYRDAGADMLFVEAPQSEDELRLIGEQLSGIPLVANMVEDGKTPLLPPRRLAEMGYRLVLYPISALLSATRTAQRVYAEILADGVNGEPRVRFADYNQIVGLDDFLSRDRGANRK